MHSFLKILKLILIQMNSKTACFMIIQRDLLIGVWIVISCDEVFIKIYFIILFSNFIGTIECYKYPLKFYLIF